MAGLLRNRSIPTPLEREIASAMAGQLHICPGCGSCKRSKSSVVCPGYVAPMCEKCDGGKKMLPCWDVINRRGYIRGWVCGGSYNEAMQSAKDQPEFDKLPGFRVSPAY
jgi:hypothetical protein